MPFKKVELTPEQRQALARVRTLRLEMVEISRAYEPQINEAVRDALSLEVTWTALGEALGVTRKAASDRYLRLLPPVGEHE